MKKQLRICGMMLLTVISLYSIASCSKDDDENSETPIVETKVVVNDDGTTSNGSIFSAIDDKNFYLDYIKYTVEEGHLVVSGYDKAGFKGEANIVSSITYKQNTYEVLSIRNSVFSGCKVMSKVVIPNSVTSIGQRAFSGCSGLTSITIPNSVTSIGLYAFSGCSGLTSITIPNSVTSIGGWAFNGCIGLEMIVVSKDNKKYDSRDNCNAIIESETNKLLRGCCNTTIPNTVTSIESSAFSGCSGLTSITIPNSVTSIGESAFSNCKGLTSINIPNSVTIIGKRAFSGCTGLETIVVSKDNKKYDSRDNCNAIIESETNNLLFGCCNTLIPNSVTSIGEYAFYDSSRLTSITIPNSVTSIGYYAFSGCSGLTNITIPNSVTIIWYSAFQDCSRLTSITISQSVTSIGESAFSGCKGLTAIHCRNVTPPNIIYNSFDEDTYRKATLYVPQGALDAYVNSDWGRFRYDGHFNIVEE